MKRIFCRTLFPAILALTPVSSSPVAGRADSSAATVDLGYARYQGIHLADSGVNEFLGVRFAKPPTGDLRWRAPQDPEDESGKGVLPATSFGPLCIGVGQSNYSDPYHYSEDCLYINVFAPANATSRSKLPVWFFIQGGGYAMNGNPNINGTQVVVGSGYNIVSVNINYRVGALGFLASEKVRADGTLNAGLLDQRKALEWVQKYIHLFGGDPSHVVIHGDSAGGGSIAHHLTAYGGRDDGLFVGAIPESPFFPTSRTVAESEFQFDRFANSTGCLSSSSGASVMSCLRALSLDTIQSANVNSPFPGATGYPDFYFLPVIDGTFSPASMYSLFSTGRFVHVPVLVAGDTNEGDFFVPNATTQAEVDTFLVANFPHLTPTDLEAINAAFPTTPRPLHAPYYGQASALYGNSTFTCGGLVVSKAAERWAGGKSWNYRYDITPPWAAQEGWGAVHTAELGDIFGHDFGPVMDWLMGYYISFVRVLDPNTYKAPDAPVFPVFGCEAERLVFRAPGNESFVETVPEWQKKGCELWTSLASVTEQ